MYFVKIFSQCKDFFAGIVHQKVASIHRAGLNYYGALCETDCAGPSLGSDKDKN